MDKSDAARLVLDSLNASYDDPSDSLVLLDEATIEKQYGWVFFYQSRNYIETGDLTWMLAGNGPIVVLRDEGAIHSLGTALPIEEEIAEFEQELGLSKR